MILWDVYNYIPYLGWILWGQVEGYDYTDALDEAMWWYGYDVEVEPAW